jgi:hypothetical protein
MRTVQKTLTGATVSRQTVVQPVSIVDMIWLPVRYLISTVNLQSLLLLLAFLTYGVGDGITAAYMMELRGPVVEDAPPLARAFSTRLIRRRDAIRRISDQ